MKKGIRKTITAKMLYHNSSAPQKNPKGAFPSPKVLSQCSECVMPRERKKSTTQISCSMICLPKITSQHNVHTYIGELCCRICKRRVAEYS